MAMDMTAKCGGGLINIRAGALIIKDGKLLMVGNKKQPDYLYTVGGRLKFGETAREAVIREVWEETGVKMEISRLAFIHENYFTSNDRLEPLTVYETGYYFIMNVPEDFSLKTESFLEEDHDEFLRWIDPEDPVTYYPSFLREELKKDSKEVRFFTTDDRR